MLAPLPLSIAMLRIRRPLPLRWALCALIGPAVLGCRATPQDPAAPPAIAGKTQVEEASAPRPPAAPLPWTDRFARKAVIFAKDIVVVGPPGLLEHSALNTDLSLYAVEQKNTSQGFEQWATARPDVLREVRCQLDQWQLAASHSIRVLMRPDHCDVTIQANGDAFWADLNGNEERGERLEFVGKVPEPE